MKNFVNVISSALFWRRFNLFLTFFWIALFVVASFLGWTKSTVFVSDLSLVALILASQSSWQSSRIEHKAEIRDPESPVSENDTLLPRRDKDS